MDRTVGVAFALLLVLAGCTAVGSPAYERERGPGLSPDPRGDRQGWERGYWADDRLVVGPDDGYNETERGRVVARAMARVEAVRGVEFDRPVEVTVIDRGQFRNGSVGDAADAGPEAVYRETRYEALFLVGRGEDGGAAREANANRSVQGYYDPREDRVVIVSDSPTPRIDERTLVHELFHAYQFRHLVAGFGGSRPTTDRIAAVRAVIEGDANLVERRYLGRCGGEWRCLGVDDASGEDGNASDAGDAGGDGDGGDGGSGDDGADGSDEGGDGGGSESGSGNGGGDGAGVHLGIYLLQYFPYAGGEAYVRRVQAAEGWAGVNDLYEDLPRSSAAVIHAGEPPAGRATLIDRSDDAWHPVEYRGRTYDTVGEAGLAAMVAYTAFDDREGGVVDRSAVLNGSTPTYRLSATDGWVDDRLRAYRSGDRTGYVWRIRFLGPDHAREFARTYRELLAYRGARAVGSDGEGGTGDEGRTWRIDDGPFADAYRVERSGATVTVVNAPTVADLGALWSSGPSED